MGRVKLPMRPIREHGNRQVTYSKRRAGLLKKAFELSLLCEVDLLVVMFSPGGKLTRFCKDDRFDAVLKRYASVPNVEKDRRRTENKEYLRKKIREWKIEVELNSLNRANEEVNDAEMESVVKNLTDEMELDNESVLENFSRLDSLTHDQLARFEQELVRCSREHRERTETLLKIVREQMTLKATQVQQLVYPLIPEGMAWVNPEGMALVSPLIPEGMAPNESRAQSSPDLRGLGENYRGYTSMAETPARDYPGMGPDIHLPPATQGYHFKQLQLEQFDLSNFQMGADPVGAGNYTPGTW